MIKIEVRYFATLRIDGVKREAISIEEGTDAGALLEKLGIPEDDIAILLVNGVRKDPDTILKEGDVVSLFPPVGGG